MNLYSLNASNNMNITDKELKHINLYILNACINENITGEEIKHMHLYNFNACNNNKTDNGIKIHAITYFKCTR